jgi:hypothetical protein
VTRPTLRVALALYGLGLLVFGLLAGPRLVGRPPHELVALSEALLQGRVDIIPQLAPYLDLAEFGGRYFVPYPPSAALLYTPFVALFGRGVYHGILHLLLAAAILPLFYLVLARFCSETGHRRDELIWLAVLLAFGTPVAGLSTNSNVYFTGQIAAVVFTCLYLATAYRGRHPGWAGLALGAAFMARGATLLGFPVILAEIWRSRRGGADLRRPLLRFGLALGAVLLLAGLYNWTRFGQPAEFGYRYLAWRTDPEIVRWGLFHTVYLERNLHALLTSLPVLLPSFPYIAFHPEGMSLLLTTPVLLLLPTLRGWTLTAKAALLSVGLILLPALFYANTGFAQYGYRYAADFLPYLILAMALAGLRVRSRWVKGLILFGVAVNLWGAFLAGWHPFDAELRQLIEAHTLLRYR